jgi:hypothetical protein
MKVSWDDDIPNYGKNKKHVPNHQPVINHNMKKASQAKLCFIQGSTDQKQGKKSVGVSIFFPKQ